MSHEDVVAVAAKTSMHEDIIREVEEIDWTIDPAEDENNACYGFDTVNDDSGTSQHDRATENDDDDFDVDELECVDEAAEDERRDQKPCDRGGKRFYERRNQHTKIPSRHRLDRYDYSRPGFDRHTRGSHRGSNRSFEDDRRREAMDRISHEKLSRRRTRESSPEQKHKRLREGDERDIPFEELELEEVDCYDELGEDCCQFTDGVSRTGASQSGEDENVDSARTLPRSHGDSILDDDFPDLCEDIDVDAMRRAAAAANNDLSANDAKLPEVISPPSKGAAAIISEDPRGGYADSQSSSCSSRSFRRNISDDRRDGRFMCSSNTYRRLTVMERFLMCVKEMIFHFRSTATSPLRREKRSPHDARRTNTTAR